MKSIAFRSIGIMVIVLLLSTSVFAATQKIDVAKSTVKWSGKKVTGEHHGTIRIKEGNLEVTGGKVNGGKVVMDMTTISDADANAKLEGHLKSDDFFSVTTFPTSELVITKVESNGNKHTFSGNLTIKGVTNPVSFSATSAKDAENTVYEGSITIDRSKYNVRYGSKSFFDNLGDKVIYDDFTLDFHVVVR